MYAVSGPSALRVLSAALVMAPFLPSASAEAAPARHARLVFHDEFSARHWGRTGAVWSVRSTAYPNGVSDRQDAKLDLLRPAALRVSGGAVHITATARTRHGTWRTGLLTTEPWGSYGGDGFQLRAGDYALVRLKLPDRSGGGGHGAWPGVWTWRGGNEVDLVEWHGETPGIAEFSNHVRRAATGDFFKSPLVGFGKWIDVGVRFGATNVSWYLGNDTHKLRLAYQDHKGVGAHWHAYLIANLSVSDQPGRAPASNHSIGMAIDKVRVYR